METENTNEKSNCGCGTNCCEPPKKTNTWKYIILIVIIAAITVIMALKLTGHTGSNCSASNCDTTKCCGVGSTKIDTSNADQNTENSIKARSCCDKNK